MLDHSNEADMMQGYILGMLCNAQSLFGESQQKGFLVSYLAVTCALNTFWLNLLLRLKYPNKLFNKAEH